jgi:hypothetical protein
MSAHLDLRALEGRRVGLALADGSRIDECQFVSAPRREHQRVWVCVNGTDLFLPPEDINDAWEAPVRTPRR